MALTSPNLDDRTFEQLLEAARQRAAKVCPEWTDWSPGSPGVTLVELFAYLTETMIYRLNRLPEKAYVEFLRLMGVQMQPPSVARTILRFSRQQHSSNEAVGVPQARIEIPSGTRVAVDQSTTGADVIFLTTETVVMEADRNTIDVSALHCETVVDEEFTGNGQPGQSITIARVPIVAPTGEADDLVVCVQSTLEEIGTARCRKYGDHVYRIWSEVGHFNELDGDRHVYVADRAAGTITFASAIRTFTNENDHNRPEMLAEVPDNNCKIRICYRTGGGPSGNVAAGKLTTLLDPVEGEVDVTNPEAATGGTDAETLANALVRGPQQLHTQDRAVTARDFERIACRFGSIARAQAATQAELWEHAQPGTVEILLIPEISAAERQGGRITARQMTDRQTTDAIKSVSAELERCRPLGSTLDVQWTDYKEVRVKTRIRVFSGEDTHQIELQVRERLNQFISPLPTPSMPDGWQFGHPLPAGRLYDEIFRVPGVKEIEHLRLIEDDSPTEPVQSIDADHFQKSTWHVVSGGNLYRSLDDGRSWQHLSLPAKGDETVHLVCQHSNRAGYVAAVTYQHSDASKPSIYYSGDCGLSWQLLGRIDYQIHDLKWIQRGDQPTLLLATALGLKELGVHVGMPPETIQIEGLPESVGVWKIAVTNNSSDQNVHVAIAATDESGVWISYEAGSSRTFLPIGLKGRDVRSLVFQQVNSRPVLWAGTRVVGSLPVEGCFRWENLGDEWQQVLTGWPGDAGSCLSLAAYKSKLFAATYGGGILCTDTSRSDDTNWQSVKPACGLPVGHNNRRFVPIQTLAVEPIDGGLMAGCDDGLFHSRDGGYHFDVACKKERIDSIPLPRQMLFCVGEHELEVLPEE